MYLCTIYVFRFEIMNNVTINKQVGLSEHFTLAELCKTKVKTKDGNIPNHVAIENLKRLTGWLEKLRARVNPLPTSPRGRRSAHHY